MATEEQIVDRVNARIQAEEIFALAVDETEGWGDDTAAAFWVQLLRDVLQQVPGDKRPIERVVVGPPKAMTEAEAVAFENEAMPFGKYVDVHIGQVPLSYLDWIDETDNFRSRLDRYLRNPRVRDTPREGDEA